MVEIIEVTNQKQLKAFIRFPFTLYRGSPYWVPPLNFDELNTLRQDKNPAFEYCQARYWLAYEGKKVVGRVAGILNRRHIEKWNQPYLRFGWIDFIDDAEVLAACEPIYAEFEGWRTPTDKCKTWKQLPAKARSYLKAISELTGAKLHIASVGPGRDQTIFV